MKLINLARIDFGGVATGGGNAKPEEVFDVQPTTTDQTITPTEGSVFSGGTVRAVTSAIDDNIVAGNIKEGVTILGVAGSHKGEKPEESFNVQPTTSEQTITPSAGSVFSGGTVHAVTSSIDSNIQPENIKEGVSILGVAGTLSGGSGVFVVPDGTKFRGSTFTEISQLDTSNVTDMSKMFYECVNLISIPQLDTSKVTDMSGMFTACYELTSVPRLDTSSVTNMNNMFNQCSKLTTIPMLDTSKVTDIHSMFQSCSSLTTIPMLDTSKVTDISGIFYRCERLTSVPKLNTSNVTDIHSMFQYCSSLTTIPLLDTSNVTIMANMFNSCPKLSSVPKLNTSNVTNMDNMFRDCTNLITIPQLDTSKATNMYGMFYGCDGLTTVEGIDFSGYTSNLTRLFGYSSNMPKITRFIVNGKINVSISDNNSIKALTAIDYDSVKSILAAADRTDNTNAKELAFNRTMTDQNGELAALVASCTSKGWTISGLTLN